jgi:hypothetical protein
MTDFVERLAWLRERGEFASKKAAAEAYGVGYETYKKISKGESGRGLTKEHVEKIAAYHRISPGWLMFEEGTPEGKLRVPLKGYIVAGQAIELFDDNRAEQTVDAIVAGPDTAAFEIRSDSMFPLARQGDIAFFGRAKRSSDIGRLIGQDCAVFLEDGGALFKTLARGPKPGLYDLFSYNAGTIPAASVHEARRLLAIKRK